MERDYHSSWIMYSWIDIFILVVRMHDCVMYLNTNQSNMTLNCRWVIWIINTHVTMMAINLVKLHYTWHKSCHHSMLCSHYVMVLTSCSIPNYKPTLTIRKVITKVLCQCEHFWMDTLYLHSITNNRHYYVMHVKTYDYIMLIF